MRGLFVDAHVRLLRAVRAAIVADPWFENWTQPGEEALFGVGGCEEKDVFSLASVGPSLVIEDFASEPWASLTFKGMRHSLAIRLHGAVDAVESAYDRLEALMTEPDLQLPGHFLAELELIESNGEIHQNGQMTLGIQFEALTIEE